MQFEKGGADQIDTSKSGKHEAASMFDQFATDTKKGRRTLDHIGRSGHMSAAAGGSSSSADASGASRSGRGKVKFTEKRRRDEADDNENGSPRRSARRR